MSSGRCWLRTKLALRLSTQHGRWNDGTSGDHRRIDRRLPAAYEARALLNKKHQVAIISKVSSFQFVPLNPWLAVGWRTRKDISFELWAVLAKKGIEFVHAGAERNRCRSRSGYPRPGT